MEGTVRPNANILKVTQKEFQAGFFLQRNRHAHSHYCSCNISCNQLIFDKIIHKKVFTVTDFKLSQ
jgi:hypothetical protein